MQVKSRINYVNYISIVPSLQHVVNPSKIAQDELKRAQESQRRAPKRQLWQTGKFVASNWQTPHASEVASAEPWSFNRTLGNVGHSRVCLEMMLKCIAEDWGKKHSLHAHILFRCADTVYRRRPGNTKKETDQSRKISGNANDIRSAEWWNVSWWRMAVYRRC